MLHFLSSARTSAFKNNNNKKNQFSLMKEDKHVSSALFTSVDIALGSSVPSLELGFPSGGVRG